MSPRLNTTKTTPRKLLPPLTVRAAASLVDAAGTLLWSAEPGAEAEAAAEASATATAAPSESLAGGLRAQVTAPIGHLFWPPRPADLLACADPASGTVTCVALDGDVTLNARGQIWIVDPRTGAGVLVDRSGTRAGRATERSSDDVFAVISGAGVDPLRLELGGASALDLCFVDDAVAWLRARMVEDAGAPALRELAETFERLRAAVGVLALSVTMPSPRLAIVRWQGDGPASEAEQEELAKVIASRHAGTHVLLADAVGGPLPRALARLLEGTPPIALDANASESPKLWAPIGRGRIVRFVADETTLATAAGAAWLERLADVALADAAESALARSGSDVERDLVVAAPSSAAHFLHETDGGERVVVANGFGRLVRNREQFELTSAALPPTDARHSLVLERTTDRADFGTLLRLDLDDEDLGPWRLGAASDTAGGGTLQLDRFAIPADLFSGRARFRLSAHYLLPGDHIAIRWRFFVEPELDGSWLTDLEIAPRPGPETAGVRVDEPARRLGRFLALASGSTTEVELPRGYARLVARVSCDSAADFTRPELRIEAMTTARGGFQPLAPTRLAGASEVPIEMPIEGVLRLRLIVEGPATVTLLDPRVLRR